MPAATKPATNSNVVNSSFFATRFVSLVADHDTIVLFMIPIAVEKGLASRVTLLGRASALLEKGDSFVKGTENIAIRLRRSKKGLTNLDLAIELDVGGVVTEDTRRAAVQRQLDEAGKVSVYFQRLVPLGDLVEEVRVREE